jgi:hypothetical protein
MDAWLLSVVKAYIGEIAAAKWAAAREALRKAKFVVQDPKTGEWFVKFSIGPKPDAVGGDGPEVFGEAVVAFLRKVLQVVKAATK